jgi:lysophospholipase L1-like esterase
MTEKLRIVAIGDSLMQGFQSGAIEATKLRWSTPAIVARALGLDVPLDFRVPNIPGRGLPINLEDLLNYLQEKLGTKLSKVEWTLRFPWLARRYLELVEDFYERGGGIERAKFRGIYHNLSVWGFTVRESLALTPQRCKAMIDEEEGFIEDDFIGVPSAPMYRTAMRVLNPGNLAERMGDSQVATFERLAKSERIDVLMLGLGANDCLGTVLTLEVNDMARANQPVSADPIARLKWNLTSEEQFAEDYAALAARISRALEPQSTHVFVATVPHVTIPPITTGLGNFDGTYFDAYARFFVNEENRPKFVEKLTREDARTIDRRIDAFNRVIVREAERHGWHVVDLCELLDSLAVKRAQLAPGARADDDQALDPELPLKTLLQSQPDHPLLKLRPVPSILGLRLDSQGKRRQGGLFSLDGVHPTTIGYGLVAELYLRAMKPHVPGADRAQVPWSELIASDSLLQAPPRLWEEVVSAAEEHAWLWNLVFRVLA